ncbi:MAG: PPC domain-containing protein [Anaerolineae bacterium]|nr:PPC domain-containing protein [Anaerolineae bacterium]
MLYRIGLIVIVIGLCACGAAPTEPLPTLVILQTASPTPLPQLLAFWQPVTGSLSADATSQAWVFNAEQGDQIALRAIGRGITLTLRLYDPTDTLIREGGSIQMALPVTGEYRVQVIGTGDGSYELGLSYTDRENSGIVTSTPIPEVVGVPTPPPIPVDLGAFIAQLTNGETIGGTLTVNDNNHVYTFNGIAGQYITLTLARVSGAISPLLTLYNPTGEVIAVDANSGNNSDALLRSILLSENGIYAVQASGRGFEGVYSIAFQATDAPVPITPTLIIEPSPTRFIPQLTPVIDAADFDDKLRDHLPVRANLARPAAVNRHLFDATSGDVITLGVQPTEESAVIPRLELIDPNGLIIATVDGDRSPTDRSALISQLQLAETGTYTVFVSALGESFGEYIISYGFGATRDNWMRGPVYVDRPNEGEIVQVGIRDVWYLHLEAGDVISASVMPSAGILDPVLELVTRDGTLLGIDNGSGENGASVINGVQIPQTDLYYLRVRPAQNESLGRYELTWRYVSVAPTATPPQGIARLMSITDQVADSAYQFYPFYGRADQRIRISIIAEFGSDFDPVSALLDPNAVVIASGDDSPNSLNPVYEVTLPADGTYTVRVNGYLKGGNFDLIVEELIAIR